MAKVTNIPEADHVLRHAKKKHLEWGLDSEGKKAILGCFPDVFKLRDDTEFIRQHGKPEVSLSVNWIEFFSGDEEKQLQQAVKDFCSIRPIKQCGAFAKLNVGKLKKVCQEHSAKVRVIHDAERSAIKSHSSITQLPQNNAMLFIDLCELAFDSLIPATKFPD
ncbi:MAG: hypothetical protein V1721_07665 [Pseudomonadota bacterium]